MFELCGSNMIQGQIWDLIYSLYHPCGHWSSCVQQHTLSWSCRSLTPSCCCLTLGPNNCHCHIYCVLQKAWLQPLSSEHLWPAPAMVVVNVEWIWKVIQYQASWKQISLVLVNFVHLGRSEIKPTAMSQPPLERPECKESSVMLSCLLTCKSLYPYWNIGMILKSQLPNSRRNCPLE